MTRYRGARDGGFALLIVLWTVVLISFLLTGLASSSRLEAQVTVNLRSAAELEAEADGAIATTIFALLQPARGPATGIPGVDVLSLSGLLNPNVVTAELMRALLIRLGTDARQADALAAAIVDWRSPGRAARPGGAKAAQYRAAGRAYGPPGAPFETLAELQDVLGMTPGILAALQPHLTLYWDGDPDPMTAGPLMQAALRDVKAAPGTGVQLGRASHDVVRITAAAAHADGTRVVRRAVIRIGPSGNRRGWRVLTWETAADEPDRIEDNHQRNHDPWMRSRACFPCRSCGHAGCWSQRSWTLSHGISRTRTPPAMRSPICWRIRRS